LKPRYGWCRFDFTLVWEGGDAAAQHESSKWLCLEDETMVSGYLHPAYAEALSSIGKPLELPGSGGGILVRPIPGSPFFDAMGCYPLFACRDWGHLPADLEEMNGALVSLALVVDPFGDYNEALLHRCFPDTCFAYKHHYVIDLQRPISSVLSKHHARNVRKALGKLEIELCHSPELFANQWVDLYGYLVGLRRIRGIAAFSRESLLRQLGVPGLVMLRAVHGQEIVGMILWYVQGEVGYYHLAAYNATGYQVGASFALFACSIEFFASQLRWLNLGAGAGVRPSGKDSLARFKSGWATGTRIVYFCGRIFDRSRYEELAARRGRSGGDYFPIYRKGEFE
jgi:hypothetical protein